MCANSYTEVQRLALSKLIEFEKANPDVVDDSLNVVQFAEYYGFEVFEDHLDCSGQIMISNDLVKMFGTNKVIVIDRMDAPVRQRFTIAHEMGHYFMNLKNREENGEEYIAHRDDRVMYKTQEEKYADYFASVLLMPAHKVQKVMDKLPRNYDLCDLIEAVKRTFNVSEPAAYVRLSQLGLVPHES